MKSLLLLLFAGAACYGVDSLSFTPSSASWTNRETTPSGFGLPVTVNGTGTWTYTGETGTGCTSPGGGQDGALFIPTDSSGAVLTSFNAATIGTVYFRVNLYGASGDTGAGRSPCAPGVYNHTEVFTNMSVADAHFVGTLTIVPRLRAPVYLNGLQVADSAIPDSAQDPLAAPNGYTYDNNSLPCTDCAPGGAFRFGNPGSTSTDILGNTHTVLTPPGVCDLQESGKIALNSDKSFMMCATQAGAIQVWDGAGASGNSPLYNGIADAGAYPESCWSDTRPDTFYSWRDGGFGGTGTLYKTVLGTPGNTPGVNWVSTLIYTLPVATYGRPFTFGFGHSDCSLSNTFVIQTLKDYTMNVDITGTAVVRNSGDVFDLTTVGQSVWSSGQGYLTTQIASRSDNSHVTLESLPSSGNQTGYTMTLQAFYKVCAVDANLADSLGVAYVPVCGTLTDLPTPISWCNGPNQSRGCNNGGPTMAVTTDSVTGKMYIPGTNYPYPYLASWTPGVDSTMTMEVGAIQPGDFYSSTCDTPCQTGAAPIMPGRVTRGIGVSHQLTFGDSSGVQWFAYLPDCCTTTLNKISGFSSATPAVYESGPYTGNYGALMYTGSTGEYGAARKAPYWNLSTNVATVASWRITAATNTNPIVLTLDTAGCGAISFMSGTTLLINGVRGNTAANGSHVGVVLGSTVTLTGVAGNGTYTASTGSLTVDTALSTWDDQDVDEIYVCRDLCVETHRIGHLRSVPFSCDYAFTGFYGIPRASMSMDGKSVAYNTTGGLPDNVQVVRVDLPTIGGTGMIPGMFDLTHAVTPVTTAVSVALGYTSPSSGSSVFTLDTNRRFNPSDTDYQTASHTGSSGTINFSGLTEGTTYYWLGVAANGWTAYGSFVASGPTPITSGINTTGSVMFRGGILPTR